MSARVFSRAVVFLGMTFVCTETLRARDDSPAASERPGTADRPDSSRKPGTDDTGTAPPAEATDPQADTKEKAEAAKKKTAKFPRLLRPDRFWRTNLNPVQYYVTRRKGTEQAFSGQFWNHHQDGVYVCIGCGTPLFDSETKFDSGTGWPSYFQALSRNYLRTKPDFSNGMLRTEVDCRVCDAHLGHVFDDGPRPTGLRYCINSASIDFVAREDMRDHVDEWRKKFGLPPLEPEKKDEEKSADEKSAETKPGEPKAEDAKPKDAVKDPAPAPAEPAAEVKPKEPLVKPKRR